MIALVDGNNFFVSCERVFNPKLRGAKVVVASGNDGCIISRSNEVKAMGIPMGQPLHEIKDTIKRENIHVFSSNFSLYGDMSNRMMSLISKFSPNVEVYSVDEAFLDLSFFSAQYEDLKKYAWDIKNHIQKCLGLPCSVGIARTKALAKIANRIAKKSPKANGVLVLTDPIHVEYALAQTAVGDVWGVGRRFEKRLKKENILTAQNLRDADEKWVRRTMSVVGWRLQQELKGHSCLPLSLVAKDKKSIIVTRSFSKYLRTYDELVGPITHFVSSGCEKLRQQKSETAAIALYLNTNPFAAQRKQYRVFQVIPLPFHTACDHHILKAALECLKSVYKKGYLYKKGGVYFFQLSPRSTVPSHLFDERKIPKEHALYDAIDHINRKFQARTVLFADSLDNSWKPLSMHKSQEYTTNLKDILQVE